MVMARLRLVTVASVAPRGEDGGREAQVVTPLKMTQRDATAL